MLDLAHCGMTFWAFATCGAKCEFWMVTQSGNWCVYFQLINYYSLNL